MLKALDGGGVGRASTVIAALDWVVQHQDELGIRVVNLNFGGPPSDKTDPLVQAVDAAVDHGLVVVVVAGNNGPLTDSITTPGISRKAITVGAVADVSENGFYLAPSSSRGGKSGPVKPDVVAPGVGISAAQAFSADQYSRLSGTSMACAVTSGVAALLLAANPLLDPAAVKKALTSSAEDWGPPGPDNLYGYGRLDALRAMTLVLGKEVPDSEGPNHFACDFRLDDKRQIILDYAIQTPFLPLAATLIADSYKKDDEYVMRLFDSSGVLVYEVVEPSRQATLTYSPPNPGVFRLVIEKRTGSGRTDVVIDSSVWGQLLRIVGGKDKTVAR